MEDWVKEITKQGKRLPVARQMDYESLAARRSDQMISSYDYFCMLDTVHPRCSVECWDTHQWGDVISVIRDRYGVPVCFRVIYQDGDDWGYDYVNVKDVTIFEPWKYAYDGMANYVNYAFLLGEDAEMPLPDDEEEEGEE